MRSSFTQQEVADYRSNGFLAVADFLSSDELAHWREVVDATVADVGVGNSGRNSEKVFTQRMHLRRTNTAAQQLVEDPRVAQLVAELEGVDAVRLYLDQALIKEPYGAPTQYHLDVPWWGFDSPQACTIWVALDDSTLDTRRSSPTTFPGASAASRPRRCRCRAPASAPECAAHASPSAPRVDAAAHASDAAVAITDPPDQLQTTLVWRTDDRSATNRAFRAAARDAFASERNGLALG